MLRAALCLVLFLVTACTSDNNKQTSEKARGTLRFILPRGTRSLDPRKAESLAQQSLALWLFEGLTRVGPNGEIQLATASRVDISDDQTTYIFRLRETYWSSGHPLTAFDFEYAWQESLESRIPFPQGELLQVLKKVQALDDSTLVVELKEPLSYFLALLATPAFFPINSIVDRDQSHWALSAGETFSSNGPFRLVEWKHGKRFVFEKNPRYWDRSAVGLARVELEEGDAELAKAAFADGRVHWLGAPFHRMEEDNENESSLGPGFVYCHFDVKRLDSHRRCALCWAVDQRSLEEDKWTHEEWIHNKARKVLSHQWVNGEESFQLAFEKASLRPLAQALKERWEGIFPIKLELIEGSEKADIVLKEEYIATGEPIEVLHRLPQGHNVVYQQLVEMAKKTTEADKRHEVVELAEQLLVEDAEILPLLRERVSYKQRQGWQALHLHPFGRLDIKEARSNRRG